MVSVADVAQRHMDVAAELDADMSSHSQEAYLQCSIQKILAGYQYVREEELMRNGGGSGVCALRAAQARSTQRQ